MKHYLVAGHNANPILRLGSRWFNGLLPNRSVGWCTYLVCLTKAHAKRQYLRLPVKTRQVDLRGTGKPQVLLHGRQKSWT